MQFVTERVRFDRDILTIVFPVSKSTLIANKLKKLLESKISFNSMERFIVLNGGFIKEPF